MTLSHDAQYIYDTRLALGLSQFEFADLLGVTDSAVCRWENGNRPVPGPVRKLVDMMQKKAKRK